MMSTILFNVEGVFICVLTQSRDSRTRTDDFLFPKQALYQAELYPESATR